MYGINSVNHAIRANAHILGRDIPNKDKNAKEIYTTIAIVKHNHNCAFNHNHILR